MSKKVIVINGKSYIANDEDGTLEQVEVEEEETVEETEETEVEEEDVDEKIDEAADKIMKSIGMDKLKTAVEDIQKKMNTNTDKKVSELINLEKLMNKSVDEMTSKEKITGFFQALVQRNAPVLKALSEGTASDGGYLFPDEFRAELIRDIQESPRMRNEVKVIPMKRDIMNMPTLEDRPLVTWTEENAVKSTTTAHFGQKTLTAKKMAAILYASDELVADSEYFDVVNMIIGLFSEAIGDEEDRVITAGNDSTQPMGYSVGVGTSGIKERTCSGNLSFDNLINLEYDLPGKYNQNAKFYVNRNNIRELRLLKDNDGRYLWSDPVAVGQPATFHGFPVVEDNNLAESKIYFGDLKRAYYLGDRQQMSVKVSNDTETAFTKDQTAIRVVSRIAGTVVEARVLKVLNGIS